jgi:hypothetical protein
MNSAPAFRVRAEGRLLFTLLDALEDAGRIRDGAKERWHTAKARIVACADYDAEAPALHALLAELAAQGTLANSWVETRWQALQIRVSTK